MVNSAKLMALNSDGIIARYWQFNIGEYGYQFLYNMAFCLLLLYLNLSQGKFLSILEKTNNIGDSIHSMSWCWWQHYTGKYDPFFTLWNSPTYGRKNQRIFCPVFAQQYHDCCRYPTYSSDA
jgi:hypothetical protein